MTGRLVPMPLQAARILDHVRPVLEEYGEADQATAFVNQLAAGRGGAVRQRKIFAHRGSLQDVVDDLADTEDSALSH
ncbi:hypothetical protein [Streptomyces abikoensis]|uniref:Uncharacterized protein n=1 Tax=Streptomyces abikoensis TaxID=97398 RepID=A0ABW7SVZ3_9ACTN